MAFDFSTLITDRSPEDLQALRDLLATPMADWTAEQLAQFNQAASKGAYNYTDLNRVIAAMDDINERLTAAGYVTGYQRIVVHKQEPEPVGPLPEGYTQLEYIQSGGTQYINTGVVAPMGFRAVLDFEFLQPTAAIQSLIGSHDPAAPYNRNYFAVNPNYNNWNLGCYDAYNFGAAEVNQRYLIDICNISGQLKCLINSVDQNIPQSAASSPQRSSLSLFLLALNYAAGPLPTQAKLYSAKIYDHSGQMVRDYIPCQAPDRRTGIYDTISAQFYDNAGTGTFGAGPEVSQPDSEPTLDPYTWYESDTPTASLMDAYLANVAALRAVLDLPETTPEVPADMDRLTQAEANDIERIMEIVDIYIVTLQKSFLRSGMSWAVSGGPGFYFSN